LSGKVCLLDTIHGRPEVVDEHRSLRGDCGGGLRIGKGGSITEGEDVGELGRLSRGGIDSDPSSSIS
jgi:hypothetical protein